MTRRIDEATVGAGLILIGLAVPVAFVLGWVLRRYEIRRRAS